MGKGKLGYGFTIMRMDQPLLHVEVSDRLDVSSTVLGPMDLNVWPDLYPGKITLASLEEWLESRLPDRRREDIDYILELYDLPDFIPIKMCEKSHGRNMTDHLWIKFDGEELCYNDIRLR